MKRIEDAFAALKRIQQTSHSVYADGKGTHAHACAACIAGAALQGEPIEGPFPKEWAEKTREEAWAEWKALGHAPARDW